MCKTLRAALRRLGVELTVYWSGSFVGPQIAKLLEENRYQFIFQNIRAMLDKLRPDLTDTEIVEGEAFIQQAELVFTCFFALLKSVKVTHKLSATELQNISTQIRQLSEQYRLLVPGPVTPKFHELEAHLFDFLHQMEAGWPYSEEGIESSHHWLKLFYDQYCKVAGWKAKMERLSVGWVANQSQSGMQELTDVLERGRLRKFAPRPNRRKANLETLLVDF